MNIEENLPTNEKAYIIKRLALAEFKRLCEDGASMHRGLLGWMGEDGIFVPDSKAGLIYDMIYQYGSWLKPSEVERELWPAVLACFYTTGGAL